MAKAKNPRTNNPTNNQVITMPEAGSVPQLRKNLPPTNSTPVDLTAKIRERAYQLFQERGNIPGHEHEDWLQAESEILGHQGRQQTA
jgi:hypothetical protein